MQTAPGHSYPSGEGRAAGRCGIDGDAQTGRRLYFPGRLRRLRGSPQKGEFARDSRTQQQQSFDPGLIGGAGFAIRVYAEQVPQRLIT
jgi:hypothetical protein